MLMRYINFFNLGIYLRHKIFDKSLGFPYLNPHHYVLLYAFPYSYYHSHPYMRLYLPYLFSPLYPLIVFCVVSKSCPLYHYVFVSLYFVSFLYLLPYILQKIFHRLIIYSLESVMKI